MQARVGSASQRLARTLASRRLTLLSGGSDDVPPPKGCAGSGTGRLSLETTSELNVAEPPVQVSETSELPDDIAGRQRHGKLAVVAENFNRVHIRDDLQLDEAVDRRQRLRVPIAGDLLGRGVVSYRHVLKSESNCRREVGGVNCAFKSNSDPANAGQADCSPDSRPGFVQA